MPSVNLANGLVRRIVTVSIALIVIIASLITGLTAGVSTAQQQGVTIASSEVTCYEEDGTLWEDYSYTLNEPHWIHQKFVVIDARTGEEIDTSQTLVGDVAGEEIDGVDAREDLGQYAQEYNDGEPVILDIVVTDAESGEQIDRLEAPQECYDMAIDRFGEEQSSSANDDLSPPPEILLPPPEDKPSPNVHEVDRWCENQLDHPSATCEPALDSNVLPPTEELREIKREQREAHLCVVGVAGGSAALVTIGHPAHALELAVISGPHICGQEFEDVEEAEQAAQDELERRIDMVSPEISDEDIIVEAIPVEDPVEEEEIPGGTEISEENDPIIDSDEPRISAPEEEGDENEVDPAEDKEDGSSAETKTVWTPDRDSDSCSQMTVPEDAYPDPAFETEQACLEYDGGFGEEVDSDPEEENGDSDELPAEDADDEAESDDEENDANEENGTNDENASEDDPNEVNTGEEESETDEDNP